MESLHRNLLFSIVVTEPYSSDYDECLNRAADEKAANDRPELVYHVDNMEQYDVVITASLPDSAVVLESIGIFRSEVEGAICGMTIFFQ